MDRPILFSGPMVRALLDGRKTQTRRVMKPQVVCHPGTVPSFSWGKFAGLFPDDWFGYGNEIDGSLPYRVGDHLWVREAWRTGAAFDQARPVDVPHSAHIAFEADSDRARLTGKLRPSMFMPRWASRITLTVTDVRVQRLQEISEADAQAEGALLPWTGSAGTACDDTRTAISEFQALWNTINTARGYGWDANPWVAAVSFTVQRRNIDQVAS